MFREMRRKKQALSPEETAAVLERGTSGVLALAGDEGYPYAVPLSYAYEAGRLYFHCAKSGHKLDAIRQCERASFCVIDQDQVVAEEFTTYFRSAVAFGRMRIVEDEGEMLRAVQLLAAKYAPETSEEVRQEAIRREWAGLCVLEMQIDHMSGKQAKELSRRQEKNFS